MRAEIISASKVRSYGGAEASVPRKLLVIKDLAGHFQGGDEWHLSCTHSSASVEMRPEDVRDCDRQSCLRRNE